MFHHSHEKHTYRCMFAVQMMHGVLLRSNSHTWHSRRLRRCNTLLSYQFWFKVLTLQLMGCNLPVFLLRPLHFTGLELSFLAALRETCNPQPCYMFPPHLLPQGTRQPCLVAVPCLLYRFRHPCGVLYLCLALLRKLALFLVCSVLHYKDTTNF